MNEPRKQYTMPGALRNAGPFAKLSSAEVCRFFGYTKNKLQYALRSGKFPPADRVLKDSKNRPRLYWDKATLVREWNARVDVATSKNCF